MDKTDISFSKTFPDTEVDKSCSHRINALHPSAAVTAENGTELRCVGLGALAGRRCVCVCVCVCVSPPLRLAAAFSLRTRDGQTHNVCALRICHPLGGE